VEIWNAFNRLSARRSMSGFGAVGAIPYTEILTYLDHVLKIEEPDEQAVFIELIEHLDEEFLKDFAEKQKKEQAKSKSKSSSRSKPSKN
jgi:hypothetical protein